MVGDVRKTRCLHCKSVFVAKPKDDTTHLRKHLERRHPFKINNPITQMMLNCSQQGQKIRNYKFSQANSRLALANMVMLHEYPFTIIEHHGFRKFISSLQP